MTRVVAHELERAIGQPIVVENRPGAGGGIGLAAVARAAADGYTLLVGTSGAFITAPIFQDKPLPAESFAPITLMAHTAHVLLAHPSVEADTLKELIAEAKKDPKKFTFASLGNGSISHLAMEMLLRKSGAQMLQIPYKGTGQATNDILGGRVSLMMESIKTSSIAHVDSGKLKALAVTGKNRSVLLPDVPTVAQAADLPDYESGSWIALFAPAGTPKTIVDKLNKEVIKIMETPEVKKKLLELGIEAEGSTPKELAELIQSQTDKWQKFIKEENLAAQ
nr:tripartite tricarboxylate transporter substrate-binding protein [Parapusillimonas granuli]